MIITMRYFASIAEVVKKTEEQIDTSYSSAQELYEYIKKKYTIHYDISQIRMAVNDCYVGFSYKLQNADTIVFIPPVSGG